MKHKYYLVDEIRLCRAQFNDEEDILCLNAEEWSDEKWVRIPAYEINDLLMGYDPSEEPHYRIGNLWVMDRIREISNFEAIEFNEKRPQKRADMCK